MRKVGVFHSTSTVVRYPPPLHPKLSPRAAPLSISGPKVVPLISTLSRITTITVTTCGDITVATSQVFDYDITVVVGGVSARPIARVHSEVSPTPHPLRGQHTSTITDGVTNFGGIHTIRC